MARGSGRRCRPGLIDLDFSLLRPSLFFARLPRWVRVLRQPLAERIASLKDSQISAQMIEDAGPDGGLAMLGSLVLRGGDAAPAELAGQTLAQIAEARGQGCARALIDLSLEHGLDGLPGRQPRARGHRPDRADAGAPPGAHRRQ